MKTFICENCNTEATVYTCGTCEDTTITCDCNEYGTCQCS